MLCSPLPLAGEGPGERARSARNAALRPYPLPPHPGPPLPRAGEGKTHTLRVATTGGTAAARSAGPSTASWPSAHSASALTGR